MQITQLIFAIVLVIGIVGGITANNYLKLMRENQGHLGALERELGARLEKLEKLEKRIAVLEQIVTDKHYDLNKQFQDLEKTG